MATVERVRRALVMFATATATATVALLAMAAPAGAHPGVENPYLPVHAAATLALGVPSEEPSPMVEIDVALPADFTLLRVDSVPGWRSESGPGQLRYLGGNVPQGGYAQFTFSGVFATKRVVALPVITRAADGTTVNWDQAPAARHPAALAFPGYSPGSAPVPGYTLAGGGSGSGRWPLLLAGTGAALAAAGLGLAVVRRRRADARLAEA